MAVLNYGGTDVPLTDISEEARIVRGSRVRTFDNTLRISERSPKRAFKATTSELTPSEYVTFRDLLVSTSARDAIGDFVGEESTQTEQIGTGDGAAVTFSGTLSKTNKVKKNSVTVTAGAQSLTDDGAGNLTGNGSGTINYSTGAISATFTTAPAVSVAVNAEYTHQPTLSMHSEFLGAHPVADSGALNRIIEFRLEEA